MLIGDLMGSLFSTASRRALGLTQPRVQWQPGVKYEAQHSCPSRVEVKNGEAIPPLQHMCIIN
jgi:hypothetical protein